MKGDISRKVQPRLELGEIFKVCKVNIQSFQVCQVHSDWNISDLSRGVGVTRIWDPSDPFITQKRRCKVPGKERPRIERPKLRKAWSTHQIIKHIHGFVGLDVSKSLAFRCVLSHLRCTSTCQIYSCCVSLHKEAQFQLPFHLKGFSRTIVKDRRGPGLGRDACVK